MLHHYRWALHQRCYLTDLFNASQCREFHEHLPVCLEAVQVAYERPSRERKKFANDACAKTMVEPLDNGRAYENVRWKVRSFSVLYRVPRSDLNGSVMVPLKAVSLKQYGRRGSSTSRLTGLRLAYLRT